MEKSQWFWLIYVILVLFGIGWTWRVPASRPFGPVIVVVLVLVGIIGWAQFGAPMK